MFKPSVRCATLLVAALILPAPAWTQEPTREGNIYNGQNHEPWAPGVNASETAAGVRPDQQQLNQQEQELDTLNQQLLDQATRAAQRFGPNGGSLVEPGGVVQIEPGDPTASVGEDGADAGDSAS